MINKLEKIIKILSLTVFLLLIFYLALSFYFIKDFFAFSYVSVESIYDNFEQEQKINMLFVGDIMLDRHVGEKINANGMDYIFGALAKKDFFTGYDLISCNLEGAVADNGAHYEPTMSYDFSFSPALIAELNDYGFNFLSLANNHFTDQGERGIIETRKNLDALGVNYTGCRDGLVDDCSFKTVNINGKKMAMVGLSAVYSSLNQEEISEILSGLKDNSDFIIVNVHWGNEYEHNYNLIQQELAHLFIESGADLVIGHHPHVIQGLEVYQDKLIFYSLGNFVFDQYFSVDTQQGLAVGVELSGDKQTYFLLPVESNLSQVNLMDNEKKNELLEKIVNWSDVSQQTAEQIKQGVIKIK